MCHAICESHHAVVFKTKVLRLRVKNTLLKDTNGKEKFKRMLSFLGYEMSCFEIHSRQRGFGRLFKYIFYSKVKKITFLKGNCHVNDVQIFMGRNSAGFIATFYLRKLFVHFFCIQIHRTFRSFYLVIALML